MRRALRVLGVTALMLLLMLAATYLFMNRIYAGRFHYGVWVNGIYATGLAPSELAAQLGEAFDRDGGLPDAVELIGRGEDRLDIPTEALSIRVNYGQAVDELYGRQSLLTFLEGVVKGAHYSLAPVMEYDQGALEAAVDGWEVFDRLKETDAVAIESTDRGYELALHTEAVPVRSAILARAADKIGGGEFFVSLDTDGSCYEEREITEKDQSVLDTWSAIEKTRCRDLTYVIGEDRVPLDASVTDDWLLTGKELHAIRYGAGNPAAAGKGKKSEEGEAPLYLVGGESVTLPEDARDVNGFAQSGDGELIIKEEEIADYVRSLCDRFDTLDRERDFTTADGRVVKVPAGTYGNKIDQAAETEWLLEAVRTHRTGEHEPALLKDGGMVGTDDIGDTYIEVDIGRQMLYYIVDGAVDTETPVVTGNVARRNNTPPGVYAIYYMQKNRTLRGDGYASFVNYWIAFYGHYGIHDATWRSAFGNEIYKTSGSHGCVNIPLSVAGPLYKKLSIGVPVVVHE